jgi:hypothetical protein
LAKDSRTGFAIDLFGLESCLAQLHSVRL